jgi:putative ATP-binding cassette transporter
VVFFGIVSQTMLAKLGTKIVFDLQNIMGRRLLQTPYEKIEKMGGHKVMATLEKDVASFSEGLMLLPQLVYNIITLVLCLSYMLYSSWQLSLLVIGTIVIVFLLSNIFTKFAMNDMENLRENQDDLFSGLKTLVSGGKELSINSNRKYHFYTNILSPVFAKMRNNSLKIAKTFIILDNFTGILVFCLIGSVIYGAGYFPGVTTGIVISFTFLIFYLIEPVEGLVGILEEFGSFMVAYKKVESLELSEDAELPEGQLSDDGMPTTWKSIHFKDIHYSYEANNEDYAFSVGPINLSFERGQTYFLTGGNGCGKSTFAKLMVGLYKASSGSICLDDKLVGEQVPEDWYRANFSTIFSDFFLFDHALTRDGKLADDSVIAKHLDTLNLSDKVQSENGVLSSVDLSQGQKKRLALLLSFIEDCPICVYDEWAADQDPYFRQYFYSVILPEAKKKGKTMIIITHDEQYFHLADVHIKFESGLAKVINNDVPLEKLSSSLVDFNIESEILG